MYLPNHLVDTAHLENIRDTSLQFKPLEVEVISPFGGKFYGHDFPGLSGETLLVMILVCSYYQPEASQQGPETRTMLTLVAP